MDFLFGLLIQLLSTLLLLRMLLQAVQADFYNPLSQTVFKLSAPLVEPLGRLLPAIGRLNTAALVAALALRFGYFVFFGDAVADALLRASYGLLSLLLDIYFWGIFIMVIASWVGGHGSPMLAVVMQVIDPYLAPFRRLIPPLGMIDLSPMVAILVLIMVRDRGLPMLFNWLYTVLL